MFNEDKIVAAIVAGMTLVIGCAILWTGNHSILKSDLMHSFLNHGLPFWINKKFLQIWYAQFLGALF